LLLSRGLRELSGRRCRAVRRVALISVSELFMTERSGPGAASDCFGSL
jgi:hypothetical protein